MRITVSATSSPPLAETLPLRRGLRAALPGVAGDMAASIRRRTESGRDVNGRPLQRKADGSPVQPDRHRPDGRIVPAASGDRYRLHALADREA